MATRDSHNDHNRGRGRRDLLVFLLVLVVGFICLLITAQMAVRMDRRWQVSANMFSELDPDEGLDVGGERVEPLRPEVMTLPPWDPSRILTPVGQPVVVPTAVVGPVPSGTSTPQDAAVVPTPSPSATSTPRTRTPTPTGTSTPTPTSTGTSTPTPTSTGTPTPTPTPTGTPTGTPTSTPTGTSTATSTPVPIPPTATPILPPRPPTYTPTPTDTPTPTETPLPPPPTILSITPDQGVNSAPAQVVIRGTDFSGMPTARLVSSQSITLSAATNDTLTGTVPAGLTPGVYALTVINPDGQSDTLSPAYTVLSPDTTLETGLVSTFGTAVTSPGNGDDDQVQVIFLEIPDTFAQTYIHIFDADVGGTLDEQQGGGWDTAMTFSLYGGDDAYTYSAARQSTFATTADPGISSGDLIISQTLAVSDTLNGDWHLFATLNRDQGEAVGSGRVFKLSVVGANSGDDGNFYNVALSTSSSSPNEAPAGSRIFAYSWTFPLASDSARRLYPYVSQGAAFFEQHNWDMDNPPGTMTLRTPIRNIAVPGSDISDNGMEASSRYGVDAMEHRATWTVTMEFSFPELWNDLTFWVEDGAGTDLAIFTRPTTVPPPSPSGSE